MSLRTIGKKMLPAKLRDPVQALLFGLIPARLRVRKAYRDTSDFLRDADRWNGEAVAAFQIEKLREIVRYASANVPGYHQLFSEAGVVADDIRDASDVRDLPFTTKELIRDNLADFTSRTIPPLAREYCTTGGSTGIPFGFYNTSDERDIETAFMHAAWRRAGWWPDSKSAVLRGAFVGTETDLFREIPHRREMELSSYFLTETTYPRFVEKLVRYRPDFIQAYPSAITRFADMICENGDVGRIAPKGILFGSENLYGWQKELAKKAFPGAALFAWYGHCEKAVQAPWCEKGETYHAWPFYGLTELLGRSGEAVAQGETGEIVGTSFWMRATPFIRYRTMDYAVMGPPKCPSCGRETVILSSIEGRSQEIVVTGKGRHISMTAINMHDDIFDPIKQFRFVQERMGEVVFEYVPKASFVEKQAEDIRRRLMGKFGDDVEIGMRRVEEIPRTRSGKFRFLEQRLDVRFGDRES